MIKKFVVKKVVFFLFISMLFSCNQNVEEETFEIKAENEFVKIEESIKVCVNQKNFDKIKWFVDEKFVSSEKSLNFIPTKKEKRYKIYAKIEKNGKSFKTTSCDVFVTSNSKYIKEIYKFLDKYDIKTALSVGIKGRDFLYNIDTGYSSLDSKIENTDETFHYVYSISKTFVATLILKLIEENKLSLQNKISDYFVNLDETYINIEATIEELLIHRSGIQDFVNNPKIFYENPFLNSEWNPEFLLRLIKTPATERGQFSYSSTNYILLGMIIEKVTNQKLNNLLYETFF